MSRLLLLVSFVLLSLASCGGHPAADYGGVTYATPPSDWTAVNAGGPGTNGWPINPSATSGGGTTP